MINPASKAPSAAPIHMAGPAPEISGGERYEPAGDHFAAAPDLPYRQDDPRWGKDLMWDRDLVIKADTKLNGEPKTKAESLMREFDDGNTIANEGCQLTSLAMVLRLLAPPTGKPWTPKNLNHAAQRAYFYTPCGLSMAPLNADLVSEVTNGDVQLCLKEEYLAGVPSWPKVRCNTSALVRAYRSLPPEERKDFVVMLKTGTYDDTVASHYLLLDPNDPGPPDDDNPLVLDPAKPLDETMPWHLSDSAAKITEDPEIAEEWKKSGIEPTQIGGAWVFARRGSRHDPPHVAPLAKAWASEIATVKK